jgi:hypothetical protein
VLQALHRHTLLDTGSRQVPSGPFQGLGQPDVPAGEVPVDGHLATLAPGHGTVAGHSETGAASSGVLVNTSVEPDNL